MGVPIARIVNVSLGAVPSGVKSHNMNIVCIVTDSAKVLNSNTRALVYKSLSAIEQDFGINSKEYQNAKYIFAQSNNPVSTGSGYLVIGYWRAKQETVSATSAMLKGKSLSESVVLGALQSITNGGFSIKIDDNDIINIQNLDFSECTSLSDVVVLISSKITGAKVELNSSNEIVITSSTSGINSKVSYAENIDSFDDIVSILCLANGTGAVLTNGKDKQILEAETKEEALNQIKALEDIKGVVFLDKPSVSEAEVLSSWASSNDTIIYDVFSSLDNLKASNNNFVWKNKDKKGINYRTLFNFDGDRGLAIAYMSRVHSINFNGSTTAITMNLKSLTNCTPIDLTESQVEMAQKVGLDFYTTIAGEATLYTSGANEFMDNVYNMIAIKKYMQIRVFNALKTSFTKIPQTDAGVREIIVRLEQELERFKKAGVIAGGHWNSKTVFGNKDLFISQIKTLGYFVYVQPLSEQTQDEREARKAPLIQVAFKLAGAIHGVEIAMVYEK